MGIFGGLFGGGLVIFSSASSFKEETVCKITTIIMITVLLKIPKSECFKIWGAFISCIRSMILYNSILVRRSLPFFSDG